MSVYFSYFKMAKGKILLGSTPVQSIYLGSKKIFPVDASPTFIFKLNFYRFYLAVEKDKKFTVKHAGESKIYHFVGKGLTVPIEIELGNHTTGTNVTVELDASTTEFNFDSNIHTNNSVVTEATIVDLGKITVLSKLFRNQSFLTKVIVHADMSKVTSYYYSFEGCTKLTSISKINITSVVTHLTRTWSACKNLKFDNFKFTDLSNVVDMDHTFDNCILLDELPALDLRKCKRIRSAFSGTSLTSMTLDTAIVEDASYTWYQSRKLRCINGTLGFTHLSSDNNKRRHAYTETPSLIAPPASGTHVRNGDTAARGTWTNTDRNCAPFNILVTASVKPIVNNKDIDIFDNSDGTWSLISYKPIDTFTFDTSVKPSITKIEIIKESLTKLTGTFSVLSNMTDFISDSSHFKKVKTFKFAWARCTKLKSFGDIDNKVADDFSGAWTNCSSLESVGSITGILAYHFSGAWSHCTKLKCIKNLHVPRGSGNSTFSSCTALTQPPPHGSNVRNGNYLRKGIWNNPNPCP